MRSFFTRHDTATWPRQGHLHVYLHPGEEVAALAGAYQKRLAERHVANLPAIAAQWLHITVEKINAYSDDLPAGSKAALVEHLSVRLARVPAFILNVGPHLIGQHSIELDAQPDQPWRDLRQAVREAAVAALGHDAVTPMRGPGRPHITLNYATGNVDIEPHLGALNHVRSGRARLRVAAADLVAVTQHPDRGLYTWQKISSIPLGGPV